MSKFLRVVLIIALVIIVLLLIRACSDDNNLGNQNPAPNTGDAQNETGDFIGIPGDAQNETGDFIGTPGEVDNDMSQAEQEALVEAYVRDNISVLSPEPEVLGGTFYVTNISFTNQGEGEVEYEDGHIALIADFTYTVDANEDVEVELSNVRE